MGQWLKNCITGNFGKGAFAPTQHQREREREKEELYVFWWGFVSSDVFLRERERGVICFLVGFRSDVFLRERDR